MLYLTSVDPEESATSLDIRRLSSSIKEIAHILSTAVRIKNEYKPNDIRGYPLLLKSKKEPCNLVSWAISNPLNFLYLSVYGIAYCNEFLDREGGYHKNASNIVAAYDYFMPHLQGKYTNDRFLSPPARVLEKHFNRTFPIRDPNGKLGVFEYHRHLLNLEWNRDLRHIDIGTGEPTPIIWKYELCSPPFFYAKPDRNKAARYKLKGVTNGKADRMLRASRDTAQQPTSRLRRRKIHPLGGAEVLTKGRAD